MSAKHFRGKARILSRKTIARNYIELKVEYGDVRPGAVVSPGQFFTLLPPSYPMQTMRRPFAYSASDETGFSFIYEIRGPVTGDIAALTEGEELDWLGPLGSAFPEPTEERRPVLVAGGIGVGPMLFLARRLCGIETPPRVRGTEAVAPLLVIGARTAALIPDLHWPDTAEILVSTDDGSRGIQGTALSALNRRLHTGDLENSEFFTCGPHPMMEAVHRMAVEIDAPCWVSMEEMMACGVGACQGCAVRLAEKAPDGGPSYKRACVEGPVFRSRELAW